MAIAVIAIPILPDFPQTTRFGFSKQELQVAQLRMLEDVSARSSSYVHPFGLILMIRPEKSTRIQRTINGIPALYSPSRLVDPSG